MSSVYMFSYLLQNCYVSVNAGTDNPLRAAGNGNPPYQPFSVNAPIEANGGPGQFGSGNNTVNVFILNGPTWSYTVNVPTPIQDGGDLILYLFFGNAVLIDDQARPVPTPVTIIPPDSSQSMPGSDGYFPS
jgi:hypothetical protein